jgi:hypothetical protein
MKVWKTSKLRMVHGVRQRRKKSAARVGPKYARGLRRLGQTIQSPQTGRKMRSVELERAMRAQRREKRSQEPVVSCWLLVVS